MERPVRGKSEKTTKRKLHVNWESLGIRKSQKKGNMGGGKESDRNKLKGDRCQFLQGLTGRE